MSYNRKWKLFCGSTASAGLKSAPHCYKKLCAFFGILMLCGSVTACSSNTGNSNAENPSGQESSNNAEATGGTTKDSVENADATSVSAVRLDTAGLFSDRDKEIGYDESTSTTITLSDNGSKSSSDTVSINGDTITITQEGTYILSGTLSNGQIQICAEDTAKVQLVLKDASVTSKSSAAIYVVSADKVFITLAESSSNTLSTTGAFSNIDENNIDGVIFSRSDLTLNGNGSLSIDCAQGHGIVSKDELVITSGTYDITASSHALSGKDDVLIADGGFTIDSGKDAIHSENADDASKGYIYIAGGSFYCQCGDDGLDASQLIQIEGGKFTITATGKGIKAEQALFLSDAEMTISAEDDAVHCNNDIEITSGSYTISTKDDGIHSDMDLVINDGTIDILESYEGIEALNITVNGGSISLVSTDDGFNAAGGNDESGFAGPANRDGFGGDGGGTLTINGGNILVNAQGDGLDSNGTLTVNGGVVYVSGPTNSGNGSIDCGSSAAINGGICIAAGAGGMAVNFGSNSTQCSMMVNLSAGTTGTITLTDANGKELVSFTNPKTFNNVVISCPEIESDGTYTVTCGDISTTVEMNGTIYGSGGGMGGGMGGGKGGHSMDGSTPKNFDAGSSENFDDNMPEDFRNGKTRQDIGSM